MSNMFTIGRSMSVARRAGYMRTGLARGLASGGQGPGAPGHKHDAKHDTHNTHNTHELKYITERDRLLARAGSAWQRLRINARWLLARQTQPLRFRHLLTTSVVSGIYLGNVALLLFGTTTLVSLVVVVANLFSDSSSSSKNFLAKRLGNYLTKNTNYHITFEHATTARSGGKTRIVLNNVAISRRPYQTHTFEVGPQREAVRRAEVSLRDPPLLVSDAHFDDGNYTQFDLTVDSIAISLSLQNWLNGRGMVRDMALSGVRGVVDRTHVRWADAPGEGSAEGSVDHATGPSADHRSSQHAVGDFELAEFTATDVLFTLYQPNGFRPFHVSVHNLHLPRLRKNWFFYDCLNARYASGTFDNSMFTVHRKLPAAAEPAAAEVTAPGAPGGPGGPGDSWQCRTRLRVDNLGVDHLNAGVDGPFSWITQGQVDMVGDIMVPNEDLLAGDLQSALLREITQNLKAMASDHSVLYAPPGSRGPPGPHSRRTRRSVESHPRDYFVMDLSLKLHNVRAEVPYFTPDLSYLNYALIRPIVAYINANRTYIPIRCRIVKPTREFEGAWTVYDSLLISDMQVKVYEAINAYVDDDRRKHQRIRRVGFWSLQIILQMFLLGLGSIA
ncbi:hypothetical protein TPHA_0L00280 [Tetrapisispora phaffii CBS 4417]|uniref:Mitochondrial distribution and morphology protein 31 n=1 Tax=Tetrapisispora phaffii (strain ATCC 24235 / CBS 4417 / NBRC 1672 / NRRL Y-8282 / UCD 70-5) TaxID=1071381 RepID=G8BZQ6_TETPH|nr:hypothetical protein TPHA_0L00280 [Tetrapisispora phaffii CBS 4417]CCE65384.1 hypothetical protein TPHA_0L00280 [Tetrapisispora phaffii CBS 4417]